MGAVACLWVLGGCGVSAVSVETPGMSAATAGTCRGLVDALPARVGDQTKRAVEPADALGAAYGDPAIVVRCGVGRPAGFDRFAACQVVNGVAWFVPEDQAFDQTSDVVLTTIGRRPRVELVVPGELRPPAAAMVDVAATVKAHTTVTHRCH